MDGYVDYGQSIKTPKAGQKKIFACKKCGEPTTHKYINNSWECLCCESAQRRTKTELAKIKKNRKGWASQYKL